MRTGKYWEGEPREETRQEYAHVLLHNLQLTQSQLTFAELLHAFRYFDEQYDRGYRFRDHEGAA